MSDKRMKGRAIVTVKLEVHTDDTWGDDCSLGQLRKQAAESALNEIRSLLRGNKHIKVYREPEVTAVIGKEEQ